MKSMKKSAGLLLALVMVVAMAAAAFAAKITIDDTKTEHSTYVAYKLLNATNATDESGGATSNFIYTLNEKYKDVLQNVTGKTTEQEIIDYISGLSGDEVQDFADSVYSKVKNKEVDVTANVNIFANVEQGYYLIVEASSLDDHPDTISMVMLDTAGQSDITVHTKEDAPTVEQKVQDIDDATGETSGWQDSADYDIGDEVPFKITGTVSEKYARYKQYYYRFASAATHLIINMGTVKVDVDGVEVTSECNITSASTNEGTVLDVTIDDLKKLSGVTVTKDSKIVVTYTATLAEAAIIGGSGNTNKVRLDYSCDPYYQGNELKYNRTPEDTTAVFTFASIVNNVDGEKDPLKGAEFTLYKYGKVTDDASGAYDYVVCRNKFTADKTGTVFTAKGLDAGRYKIIETKVPAGYNKAADVEFTITATHEDEADEPKLRTLTVDNQQITVNKAAGTFTTDIENNSGTELPATGGIGTTIFYVVGSLLVLCAGVALIAKKRAGV